MPPEVDKGLEDGVENATAWHVGGGPKERPPEVPFPSTTTHDLLVHAHQRLAVRRVPSPGVAILVKDIHDPVMCHNVRETPLQLCHDPVADHVQWGSEPCGQRTCDGCTEQTLEEGRYPDGVHRSLEEDLQGIHRAELKGALWDIPQEDSKPRGEQHQPRPWTGKQLPKRSPSISNGAHLELAVDDFEGDFDDRRHQSTCKRRREHALDEHGVENVRVMHGTVQQGLPQAVVHGNVNRSLGQLLKQREQQA
mmetsp:Transcript_40444/g.72353  ORF Transcript_40444/g.72353 Transcript_40444/m.72353 type:complete len:251 (+) Transcript_40444:1040-1792(+)